MKTLNITDVDSGKVLDRVTLDDGGQVSSDSGLGQQLVDSLVQSLGITPAEAFEMRTGWSNGYISAQAA